MYMASLNLFGDDVDAQPAGRSAGASNTMDKEDEELLMLGYACKLFRDDQKAIEVETMLIPWNGDPSVQISRYDVRAHLLEMSGNSSSESSDSDSDEELIEELCDEERYLALKTGIVMKEQDKEEEARRRTGAYAQIAYNYSDEVETSEREEREEKTEVKTEVKTEEKTEETQTDKPQTSEPPTEEPFVLPDNLPQADGLELPTTRKLHQIMERTALFVSQQGTQMEIIIKAKQASNQQFGFLIMDHPLNPYYKHLVKCISNGSYTPQPQPFLVTKQEDSNRDSSSNKDSDQNDSDDEGYSLHPSLFASKRNTASPSAASSPASAMASVVDSGDESTGKATQVRRNPLFSALAPVSLKSTGSSETAASRSTKSYPEALLSGHHSADSRVFAPGSHLYQYDPSSHDIICSNNWNYYGVPSDPASSQLPWNSVTSQVPWDLGSQPAWVSNSSGPPFVPPPPPPSYDTPLGILDIPPPPPADVQAVIDKLAEYVARNGNEFEQLVTEKSNTRFGFLHPSHIHHGYYQWKKQQFAAECREKLVEERQKQAAVVPSGVVDVKGWQPARSLFSIIRNASQINRPVEQTDQKRTPSPNSADCMESQKSGEEEEEEHVDIVEPIKEITIVKDGGLKSAPLSAEDRLKQERRRKAALLVARIKQSQLEGTEHNSSNKKRSPDGHSNSSNAQAKRSKHS